MAVLEHFSFNSDFAPDNIVFMQEGSGTIEDVDGTYGVAVKINTHIKTLVFADGDYLSTDGERFPFGQTTEKVDCECYSAMCNGECWLFVTITSSEASDVGKTVPFRVWGYCDEQDGKNADIGTTANISKQVLSLDSDNNYPKYIGSFHAERTVAYNHNLGFIPICKVWVYLDNMPVKLPDGTHLVVTLVGKREKGFLGDGAIDTPGYSFQYFQVTKTQFISYPSSSEDVKNLYVRMYQL